MNKTFTLCFNPQKHYWFLWDLFFNWKLSIGYWKLGTGYWKLGTWTFSKSFSLDLFLNWKLCIGYWKLGTGYWKLGTELLKVFSLGIGYWHDKALTFKSQEFWGEQKSWRNDIALRVVAQLAYSVKVWLRMLWKTPDFFFGHKNYGRNDFALRVIVFINTQFPIARRDWKFQFPVSSSRFPVPQIF